MDPNQIVSQVPAKFAAAVEHFQNDLNKLSHRRLDPNRNRLIKKYKE